jgi:hypothetical protein
MCRRVICVICREREARVPDRESGNSRKRVCRECHAERLTGDLRRVLKAVLNAPVVEPFDGHPDDSPDYYFRNEVED